MQKKQKEHFIGEEKEKSIKIFPKMA